MHWCGSPVYCVDHVQIGWINTIAWKLLLLATAKAWMCRSVGFFTATWLLYLIIGVSFVNWWLIMEKDISKIVCEARPYRFRIRLDITYFCWNWKYCSKIIFKCVNSTVKPVNSALCLLHSESTPQFSIIDLFQIPHLFPLFFVIWLNITSPWCNFNSQVTSVLPHLDFFKISVDEYFNSEQKLLPKLCISYI